MTQESLIAENADLQATLCQLEKERDDSLLKLEDEKAKVILLQCTMYSNNCYLCVIVIDLDIQTGF